MAAVAVGVSVLAGAASGSAALDVTVPLNPVAPSTASGTVRLVDTAITDSLAVQLSGLVPNAGYAFHLHETTKTTTPCAPGAGVDGTRVHGGWDYPTFQADAAGQGGATATSARFTLHTHETYWVDVHDAAGAKVACGILSVAH
jgi:Cu/Zn superoxide dismutase